MVGTKGRVPAALGLMIGLVVLSAPVAHAAPDGDIKVVNWETPGGPARPDVVPDGFGDQWSAGNAPELVSSPVRDGSHAVRFQLDPQDPMVSSGKRQEITQPDTQPLDVERWYGFSVNLPVSWTYDKSAEIVSQWHQCDEGCPGGSPPLSLLTDEGHWKIDYRGEIVDLGAYATGDWTDWVFHVKWRTDRSGLVEAWRGGKKVLTRSGASHAGGPHSPYFKFGIYKWDWNKKATDTTRRVMYYDALRLGGAGAGFAAVAPRGGGSGAEPGKATPSHSPSTPPAATTPPGSASASPSPSGSAPSGATGGADASESAPPADASPAPSSSPSVSLGGGDEGELAETGGGVPGGWVIGAVLVLLGGVAAVFAGRRKRRGPRHRA